MQVLASIGQLEFFYDQAPDVMRSCSMALQLLSVAAGSYLSGGSTALPTRPFTLLSAEAHCVPSMVLQTSINIPTLYMYIPSSLGAVTVLLCPQNS